MGIQGVAAYVRRQHDIWKAGQLIRRVRLLLVNVETGARDDALAERGHQGSLIDHGTARDVDDVTLAAELSQNVGVDGVMRIRAGTNRNHEHAAPLRECLKARDILIRYVVPAAAEISDLGLKRSNTGCDLAADFAHAVNADAAAG